MYSVQIRSNKNALKYTIPDNIKDKYVCQQLIFEEKDIDNSVKFTSTRVKNYYSSVIKPSK